MGTLILLSAIPGSGKSTWAKAYQKAHPNTYIVSSDDIRERLTGAVQNFEHEGLVWELFLKELRAHENEDCTMIADATNLQNTYRRYYHQNTPGYDRHVLVLFDIPFERCMKFNKMREARRIVSDKGMQELRAEFEIPSQEVIDLYDEYLVVDENFNVTKVK